MHSDINTGSHPESGQIYACIHTTLASPKEPAASLDESASSANVAAAYIIVILQGLPSMISLLELLVGAMYLPRRYCRCRWFYVTILTVACVHIASSFSDSSPSPYTIVCGCLHVCICVFNLLHISPCTFDLTLYTQALL